MHIRKNDTVILLTGKDRGKRGQVLGVLPRKGKVLVKGIALRTVHAKARAQGEVSGIRKEEGYVDISNVMLVCSACNTPCRKRVVEMDNGKRVRACHRCKEIV